jgi:hypothetical protein
MLEEMVILDMVSLGYDHNDPFDIAAYWEARLS